MTPSVQRLGDALLIQGDAVEGLRFAVAVALAARKRNGLPVPVPLAELAAELAVGGQRDTTSKAHNDTEGRQAEWIDTQEAARMLGCSKRQARRQAPLLGGHLAGGRWLLDRRAVIEHLKGKAA